MFVDSYRPDISRFINCTAFPVGNDPKRIGREPTRQCQWEIGKLQFCASALLDQKLEIRDQDLTDCMSSEHFRQLAWQFKRMSGSSDQRKRAPAVKRSSLADLRAATTCVMRARETPLTTESKIRKSCSPESGGVSVSAKGDLA